jgi:hypothetical protein
MVLDMRATYSSQSASVSRSIIDDAPDSDLKSRRQSNPPSSSSSSCTDAVSSTNSSSSSSSGSSSRTAKRASHAQSQGQITSKWGSLDLSACSSTSILTSSYDYDNGGDSGNGDDSGCNNGYGMETSGSGNAAKGRESNSNSNSNSAFERSESGTALSEAGDSERYGRSEGNEEATNELKNEAVFVPRNPSGALQDSDKPLEEDFGEFIGGSSNSLFSPLKKKSRKSSENNKALRADFNQKNAASDGVQGAGFQPESHSEERMIDETENEGASAGLHGSSTEESATELYDISDTDLLKIAVQSTVKKNKKSKRLFPATPDTDRKKKKRRKSEKDSIDDIFGDI